MRRLRTFIDQCNQQLYHSQGLNILWPQPSGFLFVSIDVSEHPSVLNLNNSTKTDGNRVLCKHPFALHITKPKLMLFPSDATRIFSHPLHAFVFYTTLLIGRPWQNTFLILFYLPAYWHSALSLLEHITVLQPLIMDTPSKYLLSIFHYLDHCFYTCHIRLSFVH